MFVEDKSCYIFNSDNLEYGMKTLWCKFAVMIINVHKGCYIHFSTFKKITNTAENRELVNIKLFYVDFILQFLNKNCLVTNFACI